MKNLGVFFVPPIQKGLFVPLKSKNEGVFSAPLRICQEKPQKDKKEAKLIQTQRNSATSNHLEEQHSQNQIPATSAVISNTSSIENEEEWDIFQESEDDIDRPQSSLFL